MASNSKAIATLIAGVKDRDLELRQDGFKSFFQEMAAHKTDVLAAENLLPFLLAFSVETDPGLKKGMGALIKLGGLLEGLKVFPDFQRLLGEVDAKQGDDFDESDLDTMADGIRHIYGMADCARSFFGQDIFQKISDEKA